MNPVFENSENSSYSSYDCESVELEFEFLHLFQRQVKKSQVRRISKIEKLTDAQKDKLEKLETDLVKINSIFQKLNNIYITSESKFDEREAKKLQNEIVELQSSIYEEYVSFLLQSRNILPTINFYQSGDFSSFRNKIYQEIEVPLFFESFRNGFVNRCYYMNEIDEVFQSELQEILSFFDFPEAKVVNKTVLESETHNEGKSVVIIFLRQENGKKLKLVYKPREARIDDAVIETFREINALSLEHKSSAFDLPDYRIYHCRNGQGSIWEYISKRSLRKSHFQLPQSLGNYVSGKEENLQIKAVRLDDVLSLLHITDLHGENILLKTDDHEQLNFFPIDLEVVHFPRDEEQPTKTELQTDGIKKELIQKNKYVELTQSEKAIIRRRREDFSQYTTRFVPLGTYGLVKHLTNISNYQFISNIFRKVILENYDSADDLLSILEENIILDYLNNDVPYLSAKNSLLYYGKPENGILLGQQRKEPIKEL